jgi:hypothetical protein
MNFLDRFTTNVQMSNFINILSVGVELFHSGRRTDRQKDGRTDMTNLTVAFHNFANTSKSVRKSLILNQISLCSSRLIRPPTRLFVDCMLRNVKLEYLLRSLVHTYPGRKVVGEIKLYKEVPTICGSKARNMHHFCTCNF